jgi:hypothetical protein
MTTTNDFFLWFLYGLGPDKNTPGIGGWLIFLLLAFVAVIWLLYDSGSRRLPAIGWRMGVIFTTLLLLPVIIYRFTTDYHIFVDPTFIDPSPLAPYREPVFYLGVLGGLLPVILAIGYFVTYQGLTGCPRGLHAPYETVLGQCPECARLDNPVPPVSVRMSNQGSFAPGPRAADVGMAPLPPSKRKVQAWLATSSGKNYQLCEHETTIGRHSSNDIYLMGDTTVSRQHAKIVEQNGRFKLFDLGSKSQTRVNGRIVREPVLLEANDEIKFGDNTVVRFIAAN